MTREHVKEWLSLPRKKLEKLNRDLAKHYEVALAYANGAEVEVMHALKGEWTLIEDPGFLYCAQYRVKPAAPWKPGENEDFWLVGYDGGVYFSDALPNLNRKAVENGNCFRTKAEAEAAAERVRAALKGTDFLSDFYEGAQAEMKRLSQKNKELQAKIEKQQDTIKELEAAAETLDGKPLTTAEANLIISLRTHSIYAVFGDPRQALVYINDFGGLDFRNDVVAIELMDGDKQSAVAKAFEKLVKEQEQEQED